MKQSQHQTLRQIRKCRGGKTFLFHVKNWILLPGWLCSVYLKDLWKKCRANFRRSFLLFLNFGLKSFTGRIFFFFCDTFFTTFFIFSTSRSTTGRHPCWSKHSNTSSAWIWSWTRKFSNENLWKVKIFEIQQIQCLCFTSFPFGRYPWKWVLLIRHTSGVCWLRTYKRRSFLRGRHGNIYICQSG